MDELIEKHYTDKIYSDLYKRLFKNGGICAKDITYIDIFDALVAIKADGGVAILAHPGQLDSYSIISDLIEKGLDGIELNHHSHSQEDRERIKKYAQKSGLILTGGTDFHGKYSEKDIKIGEIESPKEFLSLF